MKTAAILLALSSACVAASQTPDVLIKIDLRLTFRDSPDGKPTVRAFDIFGRQSTVGLYMILEPGFQGVLTQRFGEIEGDPDSDQLDEAFIEDPGNWRAGKQYLPFGQSKILRESVYAARANTLFGMDAIPASVAVCDGGNALQQGVIGRLGGKFGASFAVGRHFAIAGSALTVVRRPEEGLGKGRGYRQVYGLDYGSRSRRWGGTAEVVHLLDGHLANDFEQTISDAYLFTEPSIYQRFGIGWSRNWRYQSNIVRFDARILAAPSVWVEPILRMRGGRVWDYAITLNVMK